MRTYITFGQIHVHSVNGKTFDKDCVGVVYSRTEGEGQELAFTFFNGVFHGHYPERLWREDEWLPYYPRGYIDVNKPV